MNDFTELLKDLLLEQQEQIYEVPLYRGIFLLWDVLYCNMNMIYMMCMKCSYCNMNNLK